MCIRDRDVSLPCGRNVVDRRDRDPRGLAEQVRTRSRDRSDLSRSHAVHGDPLDALVFVGEPTFPGCRILVRPVGVFVMRDEKGPDEKVLCVPLRDPAWSHVQELADLRPTLLAEIEHFFAVYKDLEDHATETDGFRDRETALQIIQEARERAAAHE